MLATRSQRRARIAALLTTALAFTGLQLFAAPAAIAAGSTGLVIKEVYGAGGNAGAVRNADFVELYNPQAGAQSTSGLTVQYRSAAGGVGGTQALPSVSIPPGGHYLIQMSGIGANGAALPTPDLVASPAIGMAAGGGQVILGTGSSFGMGDLAGAANVVDMVGQNTATSFETTAAGVVASTTQSLNRNATGADTNSNLADFSLAVPSPTNAGPPPLSLTNPGTQNNVVGDSVSLSLSATGGTTPYTFGATGLPSGLSINTSTGAITGSPDTANSYSVTVSVTDSAASPATDSKGFTWNVTGSLVVTPIKDIQGTGATSPVAGQTVTTEGEVTASYPTGGLSGFYVQSTGPDTADASDALFVFASGGFSSYPAIGDSVRVTGAISEFNGLTEMTVTANANVSSIPDLGSVPVKSVVPGTDCALPGDTCLTGAALDSAREVAEGEIFQPTAPWTLTDVFDGGPAYTNGTNSSQNFGELGVAAGSDEPLVAPTEVIDAQDSPDIATRVAYNNAHRIIMDDGSGTNYTSTTGSPFPWMTQSSIPRVGASVTFPQPVVFTWGFNAWRIEPTTQVVGAPSASQPQFTNGRTGNTAPADVGGDLKLATFNVLNFFPTTGEEFAAIPGNTCTYFNDRQGNHITNNNCSPNGPRGAANDVNLARQQAKIVAAINTADADIVSLEELENSIQFGPDRDAAIQILVDALNADAGAGTWAFPPSPSAANLPPTTQQDVIRTGFIYKPANVALVGGSVVLADQSGPGGDFEDAREPLAQAFKKAGAPDSQAFAVIVNHFKSKGSGTPDPNGQGNANDRRILQAQRLVTFANDFKTLRGLTKVFLVGDFNAYSEEDPIQALQAAGYTNLESTTDPGEESYNFDGAIGSLDHVLVNADANAMVSGVDIWTVNSYESVYYEYSRFNYNVTDLYMSGPFRSSDHNPEIVGLNTTPVEPATRDIQILGTNDFHGRIQNDPTAATAGAAVLAGAVKQLRAADPDTVFAAAGDLIGASTFESFIAHDKPTIDALNEAGLEVSAAGNHEFDQGYNDLVNRVMAPYDATTNPFGGASWDYLAANIRNNSDNSHALAPTWTKDFGSVKVGFIGAVTEHLPELVSPAGISQIHVTDIVTEVNAAADDLEADGADVIVLLVHEGAPNTNCATMDDDPTSDFGSIITGVDDNVDAIVSGHTHLAYDCTFPVAGWTGRPVTQRSVVSAGQYGMALNQLVFTVDTASGDVQAQTHALLPLKAAPAGPFNYPVDPATKAIVDAAVANAAVLGAQPLGNLGGPFFRGKIADGATENRGAESTLGNLVAEVQKWATRNPESGSAQIAFMNPGGLRQDMVGTGTGPFPRTLTYQQAAVVQPFANTLVNMDLTGAQIKSALEQQWQPGGSSRPFLKLGISKGFTYTFDDALAVGSRITGMWLNGTPIGLATTYSVTVNSFLASGGDNFVAFNGGAGKQDTGQTDLQAMVDYMAAFGSGTDQVSPSYVQNGVGITFPAAAPPKYGVGEHVKFDVSSWSMTNALDAKDTAVVVKAGATTLGTFPLDNAPQASLPGFDVVGKASVDVVVPPGTPFGAWTLTLSGATTGTTRNVTVQVGKAVSTVTAGNVTVAYGQQAQIQVTVTGGAATPKGNVELFDGATSLGKKGLDPAGKATITIPAKKFPVGSRTLTVVYAGDATHDGSQTTLTLTTTKAASTINARVRPDNPKAGKRVDLELEVKSPGVPVTGQVEVTVDGTTSTATLAAGKVKLNLGTFAAGQHTVEVDYLGSATVDVSTATVLFTVT